MDPTRKMSSTAAVARGKDTTKTLNGVDPRPLQNHPSKKRKLAAAEGHTPRTTNATAAANRNRSSSSSDLATSLPTGGSAADPNRTHRIKKQQQHSNNNLKASRRPPPRPASSVPYTLATATAISAEDNDADATRALHSLERNPGEYDVQIHSVLSSSKMQKKVASVLRHLSPTVGKAKGDDDDNYGAAAGTAPGEASSQPKKVTVLRARASDAGKLVSIAEIAKREIEKTGGRTWYQYISVGEELEQRERGKAAGGHASVVEETILDDDGDNDNNGKGKDDQDGGDDNDDDDFEIMKTRFERAIEGRPLVRGVPVMALFLSRTPLDELRRRFGEQTNATP
ncbi:Alba [Microdochium nivale]|nr:Alba [Microdochium nivale]